MARSRLIAGLIILGALLSAAPAIALEVGVASCDITPDVKAHAVPLAGYGERKGQPSTGVHDSLRAKVLFLRDGKTSTALVTCDLRSVTPQLKQQALQKASDLGLTADTLFLCASHTHDGPSIFPEKFWQLQFGKCDPAVIEGMSSAIAAGLHAAASNLAPARVGFGSETLDGFTRNRRWGYDNEARQAARETPALNPILSVLRVDSDDGKCRALLVHFATHPTILSGSNMLVSAEWPGVLQQTLELAFPGAVTLYCNGAEGDQSPANAQGADPFARVKDFGTRLTGRAQAVAERIKTKPNQPIGIVRVTPELPPIAFSPGARSGPYQSYEPLAREALPKQAEIQVLRIGDTALAGLPGEPICEVGLDTQRQVGAAGFKNVLTVGLANDYLGYIVNEKEYPHAGYEVDERSYYGPGLGAWLAAKAGEAAIKLAAIPASNSLDTPLSAQAPRANNSELRAGFGVADISPDPSKNLVQLGGYGERNGKPALGIHDRTMAKAIVFTQGNKKFALLTLDLLGATRSLREEILKRMTGSGIVSDNLMLAASHSHGSLEMNAMHRGNKFNNQRIGVFSEAMLQFTADRAASALKQACEKSMPIKAGTGSMLIPGLNHNRRGGTLTDNEMTILRLDDMHGKPVAVFVNYAAHPTFMSSKDFYLSADWPGYLQRELEAFLPGAIALYSNGAEGDVAPQGGEGPSAYARAESYGRKIAIKALDLIPKIKTAPDARLAFSMTIAQLPPRKIPPGLAEAAGPEYGLTSDNLEELLEAMNPTNTFVPSLRVGDFVAVGIPGEMISQLGLGIKATLREAGAPHPVIIGLANEWISYILSPEEYHKGGYEPGVSFYGETLGPFMVEQAISAGKKVLEP